MGNIEPDRREIIYYELNQVLMAEPDQLPHYWSILRDKFDLLDDVQIMPYCQTCMTYSSLFMFDDEVYCEKEHEPKYNDDNEIIAILPRNVPKHEIIAGNSADIINMIIDFVLDGLIDENGYRMSLFDLEVAMNGIDQNGYFETRDNGDLTKMQILKYFYYIKRIIVERLREISKDIYFGSQMKTAPVRA